MVESIIQAAVSPVDVIPEIHIAILIDQVKLRIGMVWNPNRRPVSGCVFDRKTVTTGFNLPF